MGNWVLFGGPALQLSLLCLVTTISAASQCYYPNMEPSSDVPCYPDHTDSHCCAPTAICLTNKYCVSMEQPYHLSRGSCTDQSWESDSCPGDRCKSAQLGSGVAIISINGSGSDWEYCCNNVHGDGTDLACSTIQGEAQSPFEIPSGYVIPGVAALSSLVKESSDTSSVVANYSPPGTMKSNDSNDVAIGAGVGVPLGVIALLSICWALWERRKRKHASLQPVQPAQPFEQCYPYQPVGASDRNLQVSELAAHPPKPKELDGRSPSG